MLTTITTTIQHSQYSIASLLRPRFPTDVDSSPSFRTFQERIRQMQEAVCDASLPTYTQYMWNVWNIVAVTKC